MVIMRVKMMMRGGGPKSRDDCFDLSKTLAQSHNLRQYVSWKRKDYSFHQGSQYIRYVWTLNKYYQGSILVKDHPLWFEVSLCVETFSELEKLTAFFKSLIQSISPTINMIELGSHKKDSVWKPLHQLSQLPALHVAASTIGRVCFEEIAEHVCLVSGCQKGQASWNWTKYMRSEKELHKNIQTPEEKTPFTAVNEKRNAIFRIL